MANPSRSDHDAVVRLQRLLEAGRALRSGGDLHALLTRTLDTARELTGARYAAVGVLDDSRTDLAHFVASPADSGASVHARLLERARPSEPFDVSRDPRSYGTAVGGPQDHGFLGAPIIIRGQLRGSFYLAEKHGADDFDDDDVQSLVVLADWAGVAIDYAGLAGEVTLRRDELERARRTLRTALEIATSVGGDTDLESILELIVQRARTLVDADTLIIWLRDRDRLSIAAVAGSATVPRDAVLSLADSTAGEALHAGQSLRVDAQQMLTDPADFGMPDARSTLIVPLIHRGRRLGVLMAFDRIGTNSRFDADNERALVAFAASAATAVATARLVEEQRLQDSITASDIERSRWARELHDETLQGLASLKITLAGALKVEPDRSRSLLEAAVTHLDHDIAALRAIIADLRPASLDELGLEPALRTLISTVTEEAGLRARVSIAIGSRLPPDVETIAYRVAQESLTNVVRHADAASVAIDVEVADRRLNLTVTDDGKGMAARPGTGRGVVGMRERAALAGGSLEVAPGLSGGTRVVFEVPLD